MNNINNKYETPSVASVSLETESSAMLMTSGFDLKNNTEILEWGNYEEL